MARFGNKGRFDDRYEIKAIYEGMQEDLQEFIGQYVQWYRFDSENSVEDPIYDVGGTTGGRRFKTPLTLPVIGVDLEEGVEINTGQGSYTTDICHLVVSYDQAEKAGLRKMKTNWRMFFGDRFVYLDTVFQVRNIQIRGPVGQNFYEVLGIDGWQLNAEELINDPQFHKYAGPGDVTTAVMAAELLELATDPAIGDPAHDTAALQPRTTTTVVVSEDDVYGGPA